MFLWIYIFILRIYMLLEDLHVYPEKSCKSCYLIFFAP